MRFAVRQLVLGLMISLCCAGMANAQYLKITTDNPTDNTRMRASGTTILTISLDTNHDKNSSTQTCNSHTVANGCTGATSTGQPLDMFSYTLALKAVGGTVTWGTYSTLNANYTDVSPQIQSATDVEINKARATGTDIGLQQLGTLAVTPVSGTPGIQVQIGPSTLNPYGFGTGFGTSCDALFAANTYLVGDPADPCGNVTGISGDWFDWDGALSASGNTPPTITAPATATGSEGTAITPITATATDPEGAQTLTITTGTLPAWLNFSSTPSTSPATAQVTGTPGFSDAGTVAINWHVDDGAGGTNNTSTQLTIANTDRAPTLAQPNNMTVNEGSTAEQVINATDPDNDPLTFAIVSGPPFMSLQNGTATSTTVRLLPSFTNSGTYSATVRATDGTLFDDKTFNITVNNVDRAPTLTQPANMVVDAGSTADQSITGTDPDSDPLTFSKTAGPTYVTVTTTNTTTGNIHLAPGAGDVGTASADISASDGTLSNTKTILITVNAGANTPPVLAQPNNMTVNEGATADQSITATDADNNPISFSKVSGPTYATVTTTTPGTGTGTGNIHLAPGFSDAGTASLVVRADDGQGGTNDKTITVTVNNTDRAPTLNTVANMTVTEQATADQVITGSDPDGDALTFNQVAAPVFMTVSTTNATSGNIHLAPGAGTAGTYAASVRATDGTLNSTVQPFTITVNPAVANNTPPVLAAISDMTAAEDGSASQTITATDADNNPVTFSKVSGPTFMLVSTTSPGTGTASGSITLAPSFNDAGTYSATVRADDGAGGTDDKSFTITITNTDRAPVLGAINPMTVTEGATADQAISATDPDGDALTFTKETGPTFLTITTTGTTTGNIHLAPAIGDAGTYTAQAKVSDGTLTDTHIFSVTVSPFVANNNPPVLAQPNDMTVDEGATADQAISATDSDGNPISFQILSGPAFASITNAVPGTGTATANIHLAPGFSDAGTYAVSLRANDGNGGTDDKAFTITVNNVDRAPTLAAISDMTVNEGATADQTVTASDPDGDAISFTKASGPAFMTLVPASATSATIHLAPGGGTAGTYSASVTASDGSMSDTKSFTITVNQVGGGNQAPTLTQPNDMTVNEGETADQQLTASDPDNDPLTFSKVGGPTFMTVSSTGLVHLAPGFADAGTSTGTVSVSDGSLSDSKSFTITVNNVNRAPTADAGGPYTGIIGVAVTFSGSGSSDPDGDALTYSWDFDSADGITEDATGVTASHTYTVGGTYTVTLTVSDGSLSATDTATATISTSGGFQAEASVNGGDRVIRLQSNKPFWCVDLQSNGNFALSDIIPSSVQLTYNGTSISSVKGHVVSQDGGFSVEICFAKSDLRTLFSSLGNGKTNVTLLITGDLSTGGSFVASLDVTVQKTGGPNAAAANHGHGLDVFAWASPNPLNPSTTISFITSQSGRVTLNVYDVSGRLVKALANQTMDAGVHDVRWDGSTRAGTRAASGVYYYVLQTPERTVKSQLVIAK